MPGLNLRRVNRGNKIRKGIANSMEQFLLSNFFLRQIDKFGLSLEKLDETDFLTGLMTRQPFFECLRSCHRSSPSTTALVFIDLNRFKPINDEYGHIVADRLLIELSRRLEKVMTTVCRFGGDEFVGLIEFEHEDDDLDLLDLILRIDSQIRDLFYIFLDQPEEPITIAASIGVRLLTPEVEVETEIKEADAAMYYSKRKGIPFKVFSEEVARESRATHGLDSRSHLMEDLSKIGLKYHLIYNLETAEVDMVEALIRIPGHHSEYFMAHHERRGALMIPVFLHTFEMAARAAVNWPKNASGKEITLSFNLPVDIMSRSLSRAILVVLREVQLSPDRVQFEILERGQLLGNDIAKEGIAALRNMGINFVLDDIGEDNANLEIIDEYHTLISGFKIGLTFTREITKNVVKRSLVDVLVSLGSLLEKEVVVEGIESPESLELVARLRSKKSGVAPLYIQGYLLHFPEEDGPELHRQMTHISQPCMDALEATRSHPNSLSRQHSEHAS